jgi:hypothetical protein
VLVTKTQCDQIKEGEIGEACSTHGEMRNVYNILVRKPEGNRPFWRPRYTCKDNNKIYFKKDGLNSTGSGYDPGSCEHCNEPSGSTKEGGTS